jgi:hypothetical protein
MTMLQAHDVPPDQSLSSNAVVERLLLYHVR